MLEFFKKNHWLYSILLLPYSIILHIYGFVQPTLYDTSQESLSFQRIFGWIYGHSMVEILLSSVIVFLQAVMINRIIINNRMSSNSTLLPGLIYVTLSCFNKDMLLLTPALISISFVLLAITELNKIYIRRPVPMALYNFGIWSTFAFIIYPPLIVLIVIGLLSMQILRGLRTIEVLQMFGGVFTILFLASVIFYCTGELNTFWSGLFNFNPRYVYSFLIDNWVDRLYYIFLFLLIVISVLGLSQINDNIGIKERKKWQILYFFGIGSLILVIFQEYHSLQHWHLIILPIAMIQGVIVGKMKQSIILEAILLVILVSIVFLHFHSI